MVVVFRLKRRYCFYKILVILILAVVLVLICFKIVEVYNFVDQTAIRCPYDEPIDIVYTWVNGSDPEFLKNLNNFIKNKNVGMDSSKQRFDDKYELKFSLRSLEMYAPWFNHVYIVTNGQIPYWLNLDYDKVTIITHEEIFKDSLSLPSFSSPAIESNLHRIPGITKRFIYFNDDVFLGKPTYIEDFYSQNKGFLIYLAWPVPQCAMSCPWMYVGDGQCDKDCYRPECQMDGGDCGNIDEKSFFWENSTEDPRNVHDEDAAKDLEIANTVHRFRAHFYKSFIKKWTPHQTTSKYNISTLKSTNHLLKIFSVNDMKNLSNFVNEHNKLILKNDKQKRNKLKKFRRKSVTGNMTLISRLMPRINIDAYSASLQHTNRVLNQKYGFKSRKVPSHTPIMIDREIMEDLQKTFAKEFTITERNRIRMRDDMQFSFTYNYFLISETIQRNIADIFDEFDTDFSKTLSDREIRTLLTKLYELPLSYAIVDHFEAILTNCSLYDQIIDAATPPFERYIDSKLPKITKELVINCPVLCNILLQRFGSKTKYTYEIVHNAESKYIAFKMINSNISDVVSNLDEIRSRRRKFICLNDNLDESKSSENELVRAILYDFYLSLFPHPSKFELSDEYRNKFTYVRQLNEWKRYRNNIRSFLYLLVFFMLCFTLYNFCKKKCCQTANRLCC